jgi:hypothetical protein
MYEVSLAFARPASIGARRDPRRQARFGIAGKRLWATPVTNSATSVATSGLSPNDPTT